MSVFKRSFPSAAITKDAHTFAGSVHNSVNTPLVRNIFVQRNDDFATIVAQTKSSSVDGSFSGTVNCNQFDRVRFIAQRGLSTENSKIIDGVQA